MFHVHNLKARAIPVSILSSDDGRVLLPIVAFLFLLGILLGSLIGLFSQSIPYALNSTAFISETLPSDRILLSLWHSFRYVLAAALLATSYLGVVLIPLLVLFRGFAFSCSISALFGTEGTFGLLNAALRIGIPVLIGLPGLLLACNCGIRAAYALLPGQRHLPSIVGERIFQLRYLLLIVLLASFETLYSCYFMPYFLNLLT